MARPTYFPMGIMTLTIILLIMTYMVVLPLKQLQLPISLSAFTAIFAQTQSR